ncbi:MAG: hypothetical protein ABEJ93_03905 [Candidatus Nanohalobium sp.]
MEWKDSWQKIRSSEVFENIYFLALALILAYGTLQTTGTVLNTDKAVVSVVSCSMYPEEGEEGLYKGDILVVKGKPFEEIKEGDTIVYEVPDRVEFSVAGQKHVLEKNSSVKRPSVETALGKVVLVEAVKGRRNVDKALLKLDGRKVAVKEGESYNQGSISLRVGSIEAMPIPVVHRVIRKENSSLETKGINNPGQFDFEKDVRPDQVYGKVFFVIPRVGLLKIGAMDLAGLNGGKPLVLDTSQSCSVKA